MTDAPHLADRVETAIDLLTRVNGEPNYSAEKLGKAWALTPVSQSYCVVCAFKIHPSRVRVVGPFATQDEAVDWAHAMRPGNDAWHYTPDVMQAPTKLAAAR